MANTPIKTVATDASVKRFIDAVPDATRRADAQTLLALMADITGLPATMWGPAIVGFGKYHYRYDSGREGEMPLVAFSPRKAQSVLYLLPDFPGADALRKRLGPHQMSVACLYVKRLADVDGGVLRELVRASFDAARERYPDHDATHAVTSRQAAAKQATAKKTAATKADAKKSTSTKATAKKTNAKKATAKKTAAKKPAAKKTTTAKASTRRAVVGKQKTIEKRPSRGGGGNAAPRKTTLRQRAAAEAARSSR